MTRDQAMRECQYAKLTDFYFDSCVFDLMATGDKNFTQAAFYAQEDLKRLDPKSARMISNRTSLDLYDHLLSSAPSIRTGSSVTLSWCLCFISVTLTLWQHVLAQVRLFVYHELCPR